MKIKSLSTQSIEVVFQTVSTPIFLVIFQIKTWLLIVAASTSPGKSVTDKRDPSAPQDPVEDLFTVRIKYF